MSKQDRQGVRTASELEQKYSFGKRFAEILGIATDARDKVDSVESTLLNEFRESMTSITRNTEEIVMSALSKYVQESELEELRETFESEFAVMADRIAMNFNATTEKLTTVDGELQTVYEELHKYFEFTANGLTIKAGENEAKIVLDNDIIYFEVNGQRKTVLDTDSLKTGSIYVDLDETAQFGNYAFVPRSNGSLDFLKVGE